MYAFILLCQLTMPPLPEPLSLEPTPAAVCQCQVGGKCLCLEQGCDCAPTVKPALISVRKPRIDSTSPITLAPDPDYEDAIAAFTERWSDPKLKTFKGTTLPPEPAAVGAKAKTPVARQPPAKPQPVDKAAMVRVFVGTQCNGGVCTPVYEWQPASHAPTKSVQQRSYQRRGIFRRWR